MTDNNDAFLKEIEDELNREKYEKLWHQYGTYVIAGAAALVAAVGGFQYWKASSMAAAEAAGGAYEKALTRLDKKDVSVGAKVQSQHDFKELANSAPGGYAALAQLQYAGSKVELGKPDDALKIYDALANRSGVDPLMKDYALLQAAALRVGPADFTEIKNRLNALAEGDSIWRHNAQELLGLAAFKAGKTDEARKYYEGLLADPGTVPSLQERATLMMTRISALDRAAEMGAEANSTELSGAEDAKSDGKDTPAAGSDVEKSE